MVEPFDEGDNDDEVQLLSDVRAHERVPNIEDVMDLSREEHDVVVSPSVAVIHPYIKRQREEIAISLPQAALLRRPSAPAAAAVIPTEASECQICLETYTSGGDRRCVVTKCGHIFCYYCIDKVRASGQPCPKCRKKLGKSNTFVTIFDTTITVVDTSLVDEARKLGEEEKAKRIKVDGK